MQISPKPLVVKKLKEMAAREGISLNALLTPFLNDIAAGKLTRGCCYVEQQSERLAK
jgi:hypothetical protein